jgi:hypothetical protein
VERDVTTKGRGNQPNTYTGNREERAKEYDQALETEVASSVMQ